jgi:hypothetical protein
MLDGYLFRVVATDDEVGDFLQLDDVEDHARYVVHIGQLRDTLAGHLVHRAQR